MRFKGTVNICIEEMRKNKAERERKGRHVSITTENYKNYNTSLFTF